MHSVYFDSLVMNLSAQSKQTAREQLRGLRDFSQRSSSSAKDTHSLNMHFHKPTFDVLKCMISR